MKKTAIVGLGNPIRSDEAIGIYIIEQLQDVFNTYKTVSLFDAGVSVFEILFKLQDYNHLILVDSTNKNFQPAGSWAKIPDKQIHNLPKPEPWAFLDSLKWEQTLAYAKKILKDKYPKEIEVYVVNINNTRLQISLSPEVKQAGDEITFLLRQKVLANINA